MTATTGKVLVLRNCKADMASHNGFKWPESGPVECPDWNPEPVCGGGLHGLLDGNGDWSLLNKDHDAKWLIVEVDAADLVEIDKQKCKFRRGVVIFCGDMGTAVTLVLTARERFNRLFDQAKGQEKASGDDSTAAASGDDSTAAASGDDSTAASSGYGSTAASSGNYSKAASSGNYSTAEAAGKDTIVMAAGKNCRLRAGVGGCLAACWHDGTRNRIAVAYVGEGGIEPDVWYRLDDKGEWITA